MSKKHLVIRLVIGIACTITIFLLCPYLHDSKVAAQYDCEQGYQTACTWLKENHHEL